MDYKLLTKALALRLQEVLPDLIHKDQKGFIKGRYIGDNVLDVYSLIARMEQEEEEGYLLMLDIQSAFDSVSWSFLSKVLDSYNFPDSFIRWIRLLYRNKEIRILNNGHMSGPIKPTRGLAQGDGLSPLLFVLTIESLALSIRNNAAIKGIKCGDMNKKIALLADDAILVLQNDEISFRALLHTLKHFALVSNLLVNREKSLLIPIGCNVDSRIIAPELGHFKVVQGKSFQYLGTDIWPTTELYKAQEMSLRSKCFDLIPSYTDKTLVPRDTINHTILGRILNVKTFVGSKLVYLFSTAPSPNLAWHAHIQKNLNQYVWSGGRVGVNAKLMYQPWDTGGMLMYNCKHQEHSLKLKWLNRLCEGEEEFWKVQIRNSFTVPISMLLQMNCTYSKLLKFLHPKVKLPLIWKDIFRIWCSYNYSNKIGDPSATLLVGNHFIKGTSVHNVRIMSQYQDNYGIYTVQDFLD